MCSGQKALARIRRYPLISTRRGLGLEHDVDEDGEDGVGGKEDKGNGLTQTAHPRAVGDAEGFI